MDATTTATHKRTERTFTGLPSELQNVVFKYVSKGLDTSLVSRDFAAGWRDTRTCVDVLSVPVTLLDRATFPHLTTATFGLRALASLSSEERANTLNDVVQRLASFRTLKHVTLSQTRDLGCVVGLLDRLAALEGPAIEGLTIERVSLEDAKSNCNKKRVAKLFDIISNMSLKSLALSDCRLTELPTTLFAANTALSASLLHLSLEKNLLVLAPFASLSAPPTRLETLRLRGNKLRSVEGLERFPNLLSLDLSSNLLQRLPDSITTLQSLRILVFKHNKLRDAPSRLLARLSSLQTVVFDNNPFLSSASSSSSSASPFDLLLPGPAAVEIESAPNSPVQKGLCVALSPRNLCAAFPLPSGHRSDRSFAPRSPCNAVSPTTEIVQQIATDC